MARTDGERIAIRENILQRLWDDANYGDGKVLWFDSKRYGNIIVNFGGEEGVETIPLYRFAEILTDDDELRETYLRLSDSYRAKITE